MNKLIAIYRLSDQMYDKRKPYYINNKKCLENFIKYFSNAYIILIADNITEATRLWIKKYNFNEVYYTNYGNAASFWYAYKLALNYDNDNIVYFVENDYLHKPNSFKILLEGITKADYVSLYDHPDKYFHGKNRFVSNYGEKTNVFVTKSSHWKFTNSTTMTFASKVSTLKNDKLIFKLFSIGTGIQLIDSLYTKNHPQDYKIFRLLSTLKKRKIATPIPSLSTHGETKYLALFTNWENI